METTTNNNETFTVIGDWKKQSTLLRETFPHLSESDVRLEKGKDEELLARLERRLGKSRGEVIEILKDLRPPNPAAL